MRADIVPGAHFPDYELTDHTRRQLSEIQGIDPMIVMYPRIECGGLQSGHVLFCKPWT